MARRHLRIHGRRVADHHGHAGRPDKSPRLLLIAASAFGVASVLAAFSPNAESLIATRALLGLAGATLAPPDAFTDPQHVPRSAPAHLIIGAAPPERAGAASGISETSAEFGGALGIAVLGSIGTAVYRGRVIDAVPNAVPPEAAEAARDTLGGALAAAQQLPDQVGSALIDAAHTAFTQGLQLTAVIGAVIALGIAVLAATLLRNVRPASASAEVADVDADASVAREPAADPILEPACAES